jgi:RNA polymerase sigma-32 factor
MYLSQNEQIHNQFYSFKSKNASRDAPVTSVAPGPPERHGQRRLTAADELSLVWRWQRRKNYKARETLLIAFQPAIRKLASRHKGRGLDSEDLLSLGNIGFLVALDKFDIRRRCRLWTYAKEWVRAEITAATAKSQSIVTRSRAAQVKSYDESLNELDENGVERIHGEIDDYPDYEPRYFDNRSLIAALDLLDPRSRAIFIARRLSEDPDTLPKLAIKFRISGERVRQIEQGAFEIVSAKMQDAESRPSTEFAHHLTSEIFRGKGQKLSYSYCRSPDFRDRNPGPAE